MIFTEMKIPGTFTISLDRLEDERGFFARMFSADEFSKHGLATNFVQCSVSFNKRKGTLRGMHFQKKPYEENKIVRCTMGALYDVLVDLRSDSPTFKKWISIELNAENRTAVYIPHGVAHGFFTLKGDTEVFYQMDEMYVPDSAAGVRWNDPVFGIKWPERPQVISIKDQSYPDFAL